MSVVLNQAAVVGLGLDLVGAGLVGGGGRHGTRGAECELLVDGVVRVGKAVGGVAVDAGEPGALDADAGLLGDFPDDALSGELTDLDPACG